MNGLLGNANVLGIEDSGKRLSIDAGDTIVVKLPFNLSTGFSWYLTQTDPSIVGRVDLKSADGAQEFTLVAMKAGSTRIQFGLRRPWEHVAPHKTFTADVTVSSPLVAPSVRGFLDRVAGAVLGGVLGGAAACGIIHAVMHRKKSS